jgi:hypothetical protein
MTGPTPPPARRRVLVFVRRTPMDTELLAQVTSDDVLHAQQTAEQLCTPIYRRYLSAGLDPRSLMPTGDP